MEDEAELVHRCHRGSHRPSRPGTLPRQAHGRNDRRGEEQPRGNAVAAATGARCDPKSGKSRSGSRGNGVKCLFVSPARAGRLNPPRPIMSSFEENPMKDRITIEGRDGACGAYIARPRTLPAPAVVVLQDLFVAIADIRKT